MRWGRGPQRARLRRLLRNCFNQDETSEAIDDASGDAGIVLPIRFCVRDLGVNVIDLHDVQADVVAKRHRDSTADAETEGVSIDIELEVDVLLGSAQKGLGIGNIFRVIAPAVPGPKKIVNDGDVLHRVVHVVRMRDGEVCNCSPAGAQVEDECRTTSVQREAAALTWRCVRVNVVVVQPNLTAGNVSYLESTGRDGLSMEEDWESDE